VTQSKAITMSNTKPAKVVFGTGSVGDTLVGDDLKQTLDLFRKHGHVELDTAATYPINDFGASEKALAQQDLSWASLSTKISAMRNAANSPENVRDSLATSEKQLNGKEIDILYFHMPDAVTPLEEQAAAMDEAYKAGKFKRFGISNFAPQQIEELMEIVERKGECRWLSWLWRHNLT
jgi:aryl-alcohol dehydrogenase-like predicted oxidoreductase